MVDVWFMSHIHCLNVLQPLCPIYSMYWIPLPKRVFDRAVTCERQFGVINVRILNVKLTAKIPRGNLNLTANPGVFVLLIKGYFCVNRRVSLLWTDGYFYCDRSICAANRRMFVVLTEVSLCCEPKGICIVNRRLFVILTEECATANRRVFVLLTKRYLYC